MKGTYIILFYSKTEFGKALLSDLYSKRELNIFSFCRLLKFISNKL